jgi:hypothetical protein
VTALDRAHVEHRPSASSTAGFCCSIVLAVETRLAHPDRRAIAISGMGVEMTKSQETGPSLPEAMRFLAHEKSAAQQYALILSTVAKNDAALYVRGIALYADAKAEFDGLIAELRIELQTGQEPAKSVKFNQALKGAAEKRIAFTSFVSSEVDKLQGARPGLEDLIQVVPNLIKAITEAGLSIWKAFREARKEGRDAILNELELLQWRPFAELAMP